MFQFKEGTQPEQIGRSDEGGFFIINASFKARIALKKADVLEALMTVSGDEKLMRADFISLPGGRP